MYTYVIAIHCVYINTCHLIMCMVTFETRDEQECYYLIVILWIASNLGMLSILLCQMPLDSHVLL